MTTLDAIAHAGASLTKYEKRHGRNANTEAALKHLKSAWLYIKANGGK